MIYYEADFETTTSEYNEDETWIWLWYIENLYDEKDNKLGTNGEAFFEWLDIKKKPTTVYFHNLEFDGEFIINYLLDFGCIPIKHLENGRYPALQQNQFYTVSDGPSSHYSIIWKNRMGKRITFLCSLKILKLSVSSLQGLSEKEKIDYSAGKLWDTIKEVPQEYKDYIIKDVKTVIPKIRDVIDMLDYKIGMTLSSTAVKDLKYRTNIDWEGKYGNKIKAGYFNKKGDFIEGEWDYYKKFYVGGYCFVNGVENELISGNIIKLDVNSLYLYIQYTKPMPYGYAYKNCSKNCSHMLQLLEVNISADIKENGVPFIPAKVGFSDKIEWLKNVENHVFYTTNDMLELVKKWYNVTYLKIIKKTCFDYDINPFKIFLDFWFNLKKQSKKESTEYLMSKGMPNHIYGKQGMSYKRRKMFLRKFDEKIDTRKNIVRYGKKEHYVFDYTWDLSKPSYIPLAIFITAFAKIVTIDLANYINTICPFGLCKYLYSDTDSVHFKCCSKICWDKINKYVKIHPKDLGAWDKEGEYYYGYYMGRKKYILANSLNEKIIIDNNNPESKNFATGLAGLNKLDFENYTLQDIINGEFKTYKLMKYKKLGGIQLIKTEIKLKGVDYENSG